MAKFSNGFCQAVQLDDGRVVGGYCNLWKYEDNGKYGVGEVSVSHKEEDGTNKIDFSNKFVRFIGKAHEKIVALNMDGRVNLQILRFDVKTGGSKEKGYWTSITVYDVNVMDNNGGKSANTKSSSGSKPKTSAKPKKNDFVNDIPDNGDDEFYFE